MIKKIALTTMSIFSGFVFFMFFNAHKRNVIYHELDVRTKPGVSKQLSLFFISDIHRRTIDKRLLAQAVKYGPLDYVIIGGDLAELGVPLSRISENLHMLSKLGPIYYVWGNNDREVGEEELREILLQNGAKILDNKTVSIPDHPTWCLCGTDDPSSRNVDIKKAIRSFETYEHSIFVTHSPSVFRKVEPLIEPDLMLAGHTHGGQVRVGKYGLQEKGKYQLIGKRAKLISNGYGTSTLPLRLGANPECHVIVIDYI